MKTDPAHAHWCQSLKGETACECTCIATFIASQKPMEKDIEQILYRSLDKLLIRT